MNMILHLGSFLFNIEERISCPKMYGHCPNYLALGKDDAYEEKVDTIQDMPETRLVPQIGYDIVETKTSNLDLEATLMREKQRNVVISLREYLFIWNKIWRTIRIQFTLNLSPPLSMRDTGSFNKEPLQTVERRRFWAVLIGIDAYKSSPLLGCVADALLVEQYLKDEMGVPKERIQRLLASQGTSHEDTSFPSRTNIVNTLLSLVDNPQIQFGDNIIIYFAGHGAGYCPNEYNSGNTQDRHSLGGEDESIEAICPVDRDTIDNTGLRVPDISDREINSIFQLISRSKGPRITFFLDSCHSGAHVRCFPEPGLRTVPPLPHASLRRMLHMADENLIRYPEYKSILDIDWRPDMSSYVIMAACREYGIARETHNETGYHGIFTRALIDALRSESMSKESTYVDLLCSLTLSGRQTPVVAGEKKCDRLWFTD